MIYHEGEIISAYAVGFGGVAEAVSKMSFGIIGADINIGAEELFSYNYGSIVWSLRDQLRIHT